MSPADPTGQTVGSGAPARGTPPVPTASNLALLVLGGAAILAGGLVAAVTGPLDLAHGSWAAAYLVLVCGVASLVIGAAQTWLVMTPVRAGLAGGQLLTWCLGNAGVLTGTLLSVPVLVIASGALLAVALVIALLAAWRTRRPGLGLAYRLLLAIVLISVPIGLLLSVLRHR